MNFDAALASERVDWHVAQALNWTVQLAERATLTEQQELYLTFKSKVDAATTKLRAQVIAAQLAAKESRQQKSQPERIDHEN